MSPTGLHAGGARHKLMFQPMSAAPLFVRGCTLRALAVRTVARSLALPDPATVGDTVAGYDASTVTRIGGPAETGKRAQAGSRLR